MFLCPEADLGFTDQEFRGRSCNSDSGVVVTFDNTRRRGNRPRMLTTMHMRSQACRLVLFGFGVPASRKLSRELHGTWGKGVGAGKERGRRKKGKGGVGRRGEGRGGVGHGAPRLSENHLL